MSRAAPLFHSPVNGPLSALPFVNSRSKTRLAKIVHRLFNKGALGENPAETVMLHLSTTKGPVLLEMMARVVGTKSKPIILMAGCEVESSLATLIASESVISDENERSCRGETGTGKANDPGGLPTLHEPSDHAPNAPETETQDGSQLRRLIAEAAGGVTLTGHVPDEMYSCHSELEPIREIESDDGNDDDGNDAHASDTESNHSSHRTIVSAVTLPTDFRASTLDGHVLDIRQESSFIPVSECVVERRPKPFLSIELCNQEAAEEAARSESGLHTAASSSESGYSADMSGRADSRASLRSVCETKEDPRPTAWSEGARPRNESNASLVDGKFLTRPSACSEGARVRSESNLSSVDGGKDEDPGSACPANAGHHWDSESNSYQRRRESRAAFYSLDDLMREKPIWQHTQAMARRSVRRELRHTSAIRSALMKLRVVGVFMRAARESAARRALNGKLPHDLLVEIVSSIHAS